MDDLTWNPRWESIMYPANTRIHMSPFEIGDEVRLEELVTNLTLFSKEVIDVEFVATFIKLGLKPRTGVDEAYRGFKVSFSENRTVKIKRT